MIVGTMRASEAKVFDGSAGFHQFHSEDGTTYGSFEVFWHDGGPIAGDTYPMNPDEREDWDHDDSELDEPAGWYWWSCYPGCLPDGDAFGPFSTSHRAMYDADEFHPDNQESD